MPAKNLRAASKALQTLPERWARDATQRIAKTGRGVLAGDTGGDRRLSGVRNGRALTVTTRVEGTDVVVGEAMAGPARSRAQWFWLEEGTRPRRQGRGRHPGTRAKRTWSRTVERELPAIREEAARMFHQAVEGRS